MRLGWIAIVTVAALALAPLAARAGEQEERDAIYAEVEDHFTAGRFDRLEELSEDYRTSRVRTGSGVPKLTIFYDGFVARAFYDGPTEERFERYVAELAKWRKAFPFSRTASILIARDHTRVAWAIRGSGYVSTVPAGAWKGFYEQMELARKELERSRDFATDDPEWYRVAIGVAREQGWPRDWFDELAEEALERHPGHIAIQNQILFSKLPKWGGSWAEFDDVVDRIVARTAKEDGQSAYARSYWGLHDEGLGRTLFEKTLAKWPRMKQGFEDVVARYPTDWNLNIYASYACVANDVPTLQALFKRLDGRMVQKVWKGMLPIDHCIYRAEAERLAAESREHYAKPRPIPAELSERRAIQAAVGEALVAGRFDELERTYADFLTTKAKTGGGVWKLALFYDALAPMKLLCVGGCFRTDELEAQTRKWREAFPASTAAMIAEARVHVMGARIAGGEFGRPKTNEPRVAEKAMRLAKARERLDAIREAASHDPSWWSTSLAVTYADLHAEQDATERAREALQRQPDYDEMRTAVLNRVEIGRPAPATGFVPAVALTVDAAAPEDKPEAYVRSYDFIRWNWRINVFLYGGAEWPRMRDGYEAIVARAPNDWNLNGFLFFACMAKDKPTARTLLARLDGKIVEEQWLDWREPKSCADWAKTEG